jgi:large subunit ribosomal protein L31
MQKGVDQKLTDVYTCNSIMKKDIHSKNYRLVVFEDLNDGTKILTKSTIASEETVKWEDGNEYPLVKVHISSSSHPFYTGQEKLVDIEGRVDKFKARRDAAVAAREAKANKTAKPVDKKETHKSEAQKIG